MARFILCADPLDPRAPDPAFPRDFAAAEALGLRPLLVDHDALARGDAERALRRVPAGEPASALYRGWMLSASAYDAFHAALVRRGIRLVNSPAEQRLAHHLPEAYAHLARFMAETCAVPAGELATPGAVEAALRRFGSRPLVLKDYVKSQAAGYWAEACFIPQADDLAAAKRVVARFLDLQGAGLEGGLVFREHLNLLPGPDGRAAEWRAFTLDGAVVASGPRGPGAADAPPEALLQETARLLPARFASIDYARTRDGRWIVLETGDGQVSEIPPSIDATELLSAVLRALGR